MSTNNKCFCEDMRNSVVSITFLSKSYAGSSCADPESFFKGGTTLTTFFLLLRAERIQIPL